MKFILVFSNFFVNFVVKKLLESSLAGFLTVDRQPSTINRLF